MCGFGGGMAGIAWQWWCLTSLSCTAHMPPAAFVISRGGVTLEMDSVEGLGEEWWGCGTYSVESVLLAMRVSSEREERKLMEWEGGRGEGERDWWRMGAGMVEYFLALFSCWRGFFILKVLGLCRMGGMMAVYPVHNWFWSRTPVILICYLQTPEKNPTLTWLEPGNTLFWALPRARGQPLHYLGSAQKR